MVDSDVDPWVDPWHDIQEVQYTFVIPILIEILDMLVFRLDIWEMLFGRVAGRLLPTRFQCVGLSHAYYTHAFLLACTLNFMVFSYLPSAESGICVLCGRFGDTPALVFRKTIGPRLPFCVKKRPTSGRLMDFTIHRFSRSVMQRSLILQRHDRCLLLRCHWQEHRKHVLYFAYFPCPKYTASSSTECRCTPLSSRELPINI